MEGQFNQENEQQPISQESVSVAQSTNTISDSLAQEKIQRYMDNLKRDENLPLGIAAGAGAALVGAVLWAAITVATEYQIGFMAVGVGLLVGFAVRFAGKGISQTFGIAGALLALLGCVLGNLFTIIWTIASIGNVGVFDVLSFLDFSMILDVMVESAEPMDFLFYAIAVYEGYRFSIRPVTEEELTQAANS